MPSPLHSLNGRTTFGALIAIALLCSSVGCQNGFFDPTEMGRFQRKPLSRPILKQLDTGEAEMDPMFRMATTVRAEDLVAEKTDYSLGANDLLTINITDLVQPQMPSVFNLRISESGMISLPLIGQIRALGMTESQLETSINQTYRDRGFIQNAQVSVIVLEARNRIFSVWGAVGQAGQYQILQSDFRLTDALVLARGTTSIGIDYCYIRRRTGDGSATRPGPATRPNTDVLMPRSSANGAPDAIASARAAREPAAMMTQPADEPASTPTTEPAGDREGRMITIDGQAVPTEGRTTTPRMNDSQQPRGAMNDRDTMQEGGENDGFQFNPPPMPTDRRIIRVPLDAVLQGNDRYNVVIRPGDEIYIPNPTLGEYYMGGHVQRVGVYSTSARKITLKMAVVAAGMLDQLAVPQRTQIVRRLPGQDREIFTTVDLAKIFAGEHPDIYLKPDDVVTVGTAWWAPFLAAVRNGFRVTYGFGFLYDRNYYDNDEFNN